MIYITERWSVYRDPYQCVLVETYEGKDKDGNPKSHTDETFHPWLSQAMRWAAEMDCEGKDTLEGVEDAYNTLCDAFAARVGAVEKYIGSMYSDLNRSRQALSEARSENKRLRRKLQQQELVA